MTSPSFKFPITGTSPSRIPLIRSRIPPNNPPSTSNNPSTNDFGSLFTVTDWLLTVTWSKWRFFTPAFPADSKPPFPLFFISLEIVPKNPIPLSFWISSSPVWFTWILLMVGTLPSCIFRRPSIFPEKWSGVQSSSFPSEYSPCNKSISRKII